MGRPEAGGRWEWLRVLGLALATGGFSVASPGVLVALPTAILLVFLPPRRVLPLFVALVAVGLVFAGRPSSGLWFVERSWVLVLSGWFMALTLRWPNRDFLPRGLGAVAGSFLVMALIFWVRPGEWTMVDWAVRSRMEATVGQGVELIRMGGGMQAVTSTTEAELLKAVAFAGRLFPALLGLASLSALALAWWLYLRVGRGVRAHIGALRDFRFNDQLVWIFIGGLLALLLTSGIPERLGTNAVVFMGALYALRGAAVVLFITGGGSLLGGLFLLVAFILLSPYLLASAFIIGLGDTWLDLRTRRGPHPRGEA